MAVVSQSNVQSRRQKSSTSSMGCNQLSMYIVIFVVAFVNPSLKHLRSDYIHGACYSGISRVAFSTCSAVPSTVLAVALATCVHTIGGWAFTTISVTFLAFLCLHVSLKDHNADSYLWVPGHA